MSPCRLAGGRLGAIGYRHRRGEMMLSPTYRGAGLDDALFFSFPALFFISRFFHFPLLLMARGLCAVFRCWGGAYVLIHYN